MKLPALVRADPARSCLAVLVLVDLALLGSLPLLVGQDLPQHLAYARILADHADPSLPLGDAFYVPAHVQPYFTAYLLLVPLAHLTSILTASKLLYGAYVVATAASFTALVRAVHPGEATPWTCLLGALLPWNPVQLVGFLPFMLAMPAFVYGVSGLVRASSEGPTRGRVAIVIGSIAATSLHFVAAGALVGFGWLLALASRRRPAALGALIATGATLASVMAWRAVGDAGIEPIPVLELVESVKRLGIHDGVVETLGIQWTTLPTKWSFVVATVLGPLDYAGKRTIGLGIVLAAGLVALGRRGVRGGETPFA